MPAPSWPATTCRRPGCWLPAGPATIPSPRLELLILDDTDGAVDDGAEAFIAVTPAELPIDAETWQEMAFIYDVTELATAVKPALLDLLRRRHGGAVAYIDPDIEMFGRLDRVAELAASHPIVLTPHMLDPVDDDGRRPSEHDILGCGVYNLGFIAVGDGSEPFLRWWGDRLRYYAIVDFRSSLFTDQRWIDFVPGYFDFVSLRSPAYNVAYWNLPQRMLHQQDGHWFVGEEALVFFHYSGYDPRRPWAVSKHLGPEARVLFSERPDVLALCRGYDAQLRAAGFGTDTSGYGYDRLPNGTVVDIRMRRIYRSGLLYRKSFDDPPPPMPFSQEGADRVVAWLNSPSAVFEGAAPQSRYLEAVWQERTDLKLSYPAVHGDDSEGFEEWVRSFGQAEEDIPAEMVPTGPRPDPHPWAEPGALRPGITVAGYLRGELGMGEAARSVLAAVESTGIEHAAVVVNRTLSRQDHAHEWDEGPFDLDTAIAVVNADQVAMVQGAVGPGFFAGRHTVGVWAWELERFPEGMASAATRFDELWTISRFAADSLQAQVERPVHVFPLAVAPTPPTPTVSPPGVPPGRFTFLFMFDYLSVFERKNPLGVIEAFSRAFTPGEGPVLVVKSINGDLRRLDRERVLLAAADHPDVVVTDEYLTKPDRDALMHRADAYVSLHHAEGFGLTMAEAMMTGKPVIATAYSGNLDFMTEANSFLVPYAMGEVPADCDPYLPGTPWADPDLGEAARLMRLVVEEPALAASKAAAGAGDIARTHGLPVAASFVRERFEALAAVPRPTAKLSEPPARPPVPPSRRLIGGATRRLTRALQRIEHPR